MAKGKDACECKMCGMKGHGICKIVLGALVLANAYWPTVSWPVFIGTMIIIAGIAISMHKCE